MKRFRRKWMTLANRIPYLLVPYVLLIQFATVSPQLHHFLHAGGGIAAQCAGHDDSSGDDKETITDEHVCAVTLFGNGLTIQSDTISLQANEYGNDTFPSTCVYYTYLLAVTLPPVRGPPIIS